MPNNYLEASFEVENLNSDEIAWWKKEGERWTIATDENESPDPTEMDPPYSTDWEFVQSNNRVGVWFHGDESTDVDVAAEVIHRFLKECRPNGSVGFTWAETCSKPRLDEFSGGGCFITAKTIEFQSANEWVNGQRQAFQEGKSDV